MRSRFESAEDFFELTHVIPAVLRGIRTRVWSTPTAQAKLARLWQRYQLLDHDWRLTRLGHDVIALEKMWDYEQRVASILAGTDTSKHLKRETYGLLREGLHDYALKHYRQHFASLAMKLPRDAIFLDYGGGYGFYSRVLLEARPDLTGVLVDRPGTVHLTDQRLEFVGVDVEESPEWFHRYGQHFDFIMLIDVLHCGGPDFHAYLMESVALLAHDSSSTLLVGETNATPEFDWRLNVLSKGDAAAMNAADLRTLFAINDYLVRNLISTDRHLFYHLERKGS